MRRLWGLVLSVLLLTSFLSGTGLSVWAEETVTGSVQAPRSAAHAYTRQAWAKQLGLTNARLTSLIDTLQGDIRSFRRQTDVSSYGLINTDETKTILSSIVFDEDPTLFMIRSYSFRYNTINKQITAILFEDNYLMSPAEYASWLQQCRETAADMVRDISGSSLKLDQMALILHDRLALWCEYDQENYLKDTVPDASHEMYGALAKRVAVCDGYAKAYKYLLAQVGIDSTVVRSAEMDHAWNILNLGGRYFHADVTWDDPVWDVLGRVTHQNFLISTDALRGTNHIGSDFDTTPADTYYDNFFWRQQDGQSAFQYINGDIYYVDKDGRLIRWDLANNTLRVAAEVGGDWGKYAGHSKLVSDGIYLYYSTGNEVYRFDPSSGNAERIFTLSASQFPGKYIVGMQISGNYLLFNVWEKERFKNGTEQTESLRRFRFIDNEILRIAVRTKPDKTAYYLGSAPTTDGLTVEGYYSDGESVQLLPGNYTVSSFTTDVPGEKTVTVFYKDMIATFSVYVTDRLGDVDGKDAVTSTDARLALQSAVGRLPEHALEIFLGDVDGDGSISSTDARLILQYAVGKIDRFPVEPEPVREFS